MKMKGSGNLSGDHSLYDLEFRSTADDAWYTAQVALDNDILVVKFLNFSESADERFRAGDFETSEAIDEFVERFRPLSQQLQDSQCSKVIEGMTVCASFSFRDDDIRFYDAVVEAVHYVEHSFAKEEEECLCTFLLFWQHGPNEGNITSTSIANFLMFMLHYVKILCLTKIIVICQLIESLIHLNMGSRLRMVLGSPLALYKQKKAERIGKCPERTIQDVDFGWESSMGETGSHHFIVIENLERNLSPSSIMEFIHKQTSIFVQAYVFPSLSSESYTRGAIVLDCRKKLKKIYEFLNNPDHLVMSSRGRLTSRGGAKNHLQRGHRLWALGHNRKFSKLWNL
ncbi:hypothetical protein U1Q18_001021 [Sarracenia purpurea var. burkii]